MTQYIYFASRETEEEAIARRNSPLKRDILAQIYLATKMASKPAVTDAIFRMLTGIED